MDLNLVVGLDALLDEASVGRAARRLRRSQPAVSRILARLRDLFGDPLLVQQGRAMVLTERALGLRDPVKRLLGDAEHLLRPPLPFDPEREARHFRLISSDYALVVLLGPILEELGLQAPAVTFSVAAPGLASMDALAAGQADLLFGPGVAPSWCETERLLSDPWACVRRRGAVLPRTRAEYLALEHVDVAVEVRFGQPIARALGRRAADRRVRLAVEDFAGALFVVAGSGLVATVPWPVAQRAAAVMPLAVGEVPFRIPPSEVSMVWPRRATAEPAHEWLRRAVRRATEEALSRPAAPSAGAPRPSAPPRSPGPARGRSRTP